MKTATIERKVIEVLPAGTHKKEKLPLFGVIDITDEQGRSKPILFDYVSLKEPVKKQKHQHQGHPNPRKGMKGVGSDYIPYKIATQKGWELLQNGKETIGFYIILAINSGFRVSDLLKMRHKDLMNLKPGDYFRTIEQKTKNLREIQINKDLFESYQYLAKKLQDRGAFNPENAIFLSQKNMTYATISLNRILKKVFIRQALNVSTHSLRKSFGRVVYEVNGKSEDSLNKLSELFGHSSLALTRRYLGIRREELGNLYMTLPGRGI